jgi:hypothetical protein
MVNESNNSSRIILPNLEVQTQIHATALSIISTFTIDLFDFINKSLVKSKGSNWLIEMKVENLRGRDINFADPSALLKELTRNSQSVLRNPINLWISKPKLKDFYDRLDEILGERHLWVHNDIDANPEQLESLVILIKQVAWALELPVIKECTEVLDLINPEVEEAEIPIFQEPEHKSSEIIKVLEPLTRNEVDKVGSPLAGPFIAYSYTLHLNGSIRDRKSDNLLENEIEGASDLGALLIARKPNGGRLRVTPDGKIAAYFEDQWGYLAKVDKNNWFPGHLS